MVNRTIKNAREMEKGSDLRIFLNKKLHHSMNRHQNQRKKDQPKEFGEMFSREIVSTQKK